MVDGADELDGVVLAGRYRLGRFLGAGGMAKVVEAHDARLDRRVAVKLVSAAAVDDTERRRFLDEARAGASFVHPHAVAVYDAGADGGWLFLVMELVDGPTLADVIAERGPMPADEAVPIVDAVLDALAAAHAAGLVHRDVKPGNVLLGDGTVKLADFGIAKRLDHGRDDLTLAGQFVGTPRYLAPEQLAGERATPASDVYGVGIVLFELLSGRPPFDGEHLMALALAHRDQPVPALPPGTPPAVAAVVSRALAKQPADRFLDASAMREALRAASRVAGTAAMPPGVVPTRVAPAPIRPALRRDRTRRLWVAITVATVIALLTGLALRAIGGDDGLTTADDAAATAAPSISGATTTVTATTVPAVVAPTTAAAPPTTAPAATPAPALPTTVADLIAALSVDPTAFGDEGPKLLDRLEELAGRNGRPARDLAEKISEDVSEWSEEGRLDPTFADQVVAVVEPIAEQPGNGNDDEEDDD